MRISIRPKRLIWSIFIFLFVTEPLFKYYNVPGTTFGLSSFLMLVMAVLCLVGSGKVTHGLRSELRTYFLMLLYMIVVYCVSIMVFGDASQWYVFIFIILQFYAIAVMSRQTEHDIDFFVTFKKIYVWVAVALAVITIFEDLWWYATGNIYIFKMPFPLVQEYAKLDYRFGYNGRGNFIGFSPFFSEPSHMAQYLVPAVCILLNDIRHGIGNKTKKIFEIGLIALSTLISTSTFGLATLFAVIVYYAIIGKGKAAKIVRWLLAIGGAAAVVGLFVFGTNGGLLNYGIETLVSAFSTSGSDKTSYRMFRGFAYFVQFPLIPMIFGVGFSNFSRVITQWNLSYEYEIISDTIVTEYLNGASQALIYGGLIGMALLIVFVIRLYKKSKNEARVLVLALVLLFTTTATFLRGISVFYIAVIIMLCNYDALMEERKKNAGENQKITK